MSKRNRTVKKQFNRLTGKIVVVEPHKSAFKIEVKANTKVSRKKSHADETYSSYLNAYRSRKKSVESRGYSMNLEREGNIPLTKTEWEFYHNAAEEKLTNKQIIDLQAYHRTEKQAKAIQKALRTQLGVKYTLTEIKYGAADEFEAMIEDEYGNLINQGYSSFEARKFIGMEYFGSPA